MIWKPSKALGLATGLLMLLTLAGIQVLILQSLSEQDAGVSAFLTALQSLIFLPLLVRWLGSFYRLATLSYDLDAEYLVIRCGWTLHRIPLGTVQQVMHGREVHLDDSFGGIGWPGCLMGSVHAEDLGTLTICSTEPIERQIVLVTDAGCYGISPTDASEFTSSLNTARSAVAQASDQPRVVRSGIAAWPVWSDRGFWITVSVALVANILLYGAISTHFAVLPERFSFWGAGPQQAMRIVPKAHLFLLPMAGTVMVAANALLGILVHRRERIAARILAVASLGLQIPLWTAVLSVLIR